MGAAVDINLTFQSEEESFSEKLDAYLEQFLYDLPINKNGNNRYLKSYFSFPTVTYFLEDLIPISEGGKISLEMEVEETEIRIFEAANGELIKDESRELDYTS